jgi:cation transport ATPase
MDKEIADYYDEMLHRIEVNEDRQVLRAYHEQRIREFQHERQMHLYVTLFFGLLVLVFGGALLWSTTFGVVLLSWLLGAAALIVFVVEIFYIFYYYLLENSTQRLYELTKRLYRDK